MKKIFYLLLILILILSSCVRKTNGTDTYYSAVEALEEEKYDEALNLFQLSLEEGLDNKKKDAKNMIKDIEYFKEANKLNNIEKYDEALKIIKNIKDDSKLRAKFDKLEKEIEKNKKKDERIKKIKGIEERIESREDIDVEPIFSEYEILEIAKESMDIENAYKSYKNKDKKLNDEELLAVTIEFFINNSLVKEEVYIGRNTLDVYTADLIFVTSLGK